MIPTTPQNVVSTFARITGTPMRIPSSDQCAQAIAFCEHFTVEELELVLAWTQKEMKRDRATLNKFSCSWKVLFGTYGGGQEFQVFQERLGMAMKEAHARPRKAKNIVPMTQIVDGAGSTITVLDCSPVATDPPELREQVAEQLRKLRRSMGGSAA